MIKIKKYYDKYYDIKEYHISNIGGAIMGKIKNIPSVKWCLCTEPYFFFTKEDIEKVLNFICELNKKGG
jgi:hypothetical protein